jgi:DNA-binding transcriptional regulator YhcF (GntR family)
MKPKQRSASLRIAEALLGQIKSGVYVPGTRIVVTSLAQEIGTSVIPVREALFALVGRGIVLERHHEGFYVAPLSSATICALYGEHRQVVDRALEYPTRTEQVVKLSRDRWEVFKAVVAATGNGALAGVQNYLAGRLGPVRSFEGTYAGTADRCGPEMVSALRGKDIGRARIVSQEFHDECKSLSKKFSSVIVDLQ